MLHPFDRVLPLSRDRRPRLVARDQWLRAVRALAAGAVRHGTLRTAAGARIDLLPYQFEPVLALIRGEATRVLIADAVGLGKTIQAGLVLAELRTREMPGRALVITPAGLRDQWARELSDRFAIPSALVDAPALRRAVASLPAGVSPWEAEPVIITSLDFVKQPEVCRALDHTTWDLLIVDEAHMAATARERHLAIDGLAARARWLVLLTATPHAGDQAGFEALCRIGRLEGDDPILMFRRSSADVGASRDRRVHLLRVALTPAEIELHTRLDEYSGRLWNERAGDEAPGGRLAAIVLRKRALSCASSAIESVGHRFARLEGRSPGPGVQLALPLAEDGEGEADTDDLCPAAALSCAGLSDVEMERRLLAGVLEAAAAARPRDSKIAVLLRLLRRTHEPAIVFTEYRDTALTVAAALAPRSSVAVLHGGLDRAARCEAERRFITGGARVLVATDAAGQGLNLQAACRLVVNLELPWNPMRLEQRIGRVDRIGQARRVHAVNLVAGGTAEEAILGRLAMRIAKVRDAVGYDGDPIGAAERIAEAMVAVEPAASERVERLCGMLARRREETDAPAMALPPPPGLGAEALAEVTRIRGARESLAPFVGSRCAPASSLAASLDATSPWALVAPRMTALPPGVLCLFRAHAINARGRIVEETLVAVHADAREVARAAGPAAGRSGGLAQTVAEMLPVLSDRALTVARARLAALAPAEAAAGRRVRSRAEAIARLLERQLAHGATAPVQTGLFDQRSLRQAAAKRLAWARLEQTLDERRTGDEGACTLTLSGDPEPMLVLLIRLES